jgi:hypothetical protein
MKRFVLVSALLALSADTYAQNCLVPAPVAPPTPRELIVLLPIDGGTAGCKVVASVPGGAVPKEYAIGNAKCATSVAIAKQAAANDNGWNDGGSP